MFCKAELDNATVVSPVELLVVQAKLSEGAAAVEVIKQALENKGVYGFGELLCLHNIKNLKGGPFSNYYDLLEIFAYDDYKTYLNNKAKLPELSTNQLKKLRHLTMVSLAIDKKFIPYSLLLDAVGMKNVRDLEDLIIEAIYADIIKGKLDQKNSCLEISFCIGRDFKEGTDELETITKTLQSWNKKCESALSSITSLINISNAEKSKFVTHRAAIDSQIEDLKKQVKLVQEKECPMLGEKLEAIGALTEKQQKKLTSKQKGIRGSGVFCPRI